MTQPNGEQDDLAWAEAQFASSHDARLAEILAHSIPDEPEAPSRTAQERYAQLEFMQKSYINVVGGLIAASEFYTSKAVALTLGAATYWHTLSEFASNPPTRAPWLEASVASGIGTLLITGMVDRMKRGWSAQRFYERQTQKALTSKRNTSSI